MSARAEKACHAALGTAAALLHYSMHSDSWTRWLWPLVLVFVYFLSVFGLKARRFFVAKVIGMLVLPATSVATTQVLMNDGTKVTGARAADAMRASVCGPDNAHAHQVSGLLCVTPQTYKLPYQVPNQLPNQPTNQPTNQPSKPTNHPTIQPTNQPTNQQ